MGEREKKWPNYKYYCRKEARPILPAPILYHGWEKCRFICKKERKGEENMTIFRQIQALSPNGKEKKQQVTTL